VTAPTVRVSHSIHGKYPVDACPIYMAHHASASHASVRRPRTGVGGGKTRSSSTTGVVAKPHLCARLGVAGSNCREGQHTFLRTDLPFESRSGAFRDAVLLFMLIAPPPLEFIATSLSAVGSIPLPGAAAGERRVIPRLPTARLTAIPPHFLQRRRLSVASAPSQLRCAP